MKKYLFLTLFLTSLKVFSQDTSPDNSNGNYKNKYLNFLLKPDSNERNYYITADIRYLQTTNSLSFKSKGLYTTVSLNLARLFSKKIVLGLFLSVKPQNGLFNTQKFSSEFIDDFNANYKTEYSSQEDSALADNLKFTINSRNFFGNQFANVGVVFSLFPNKYGGIHLYLSTGSKNFRSGGVYGNKYISNGEVEHLYTSITKNYSAALSFKPYQLSKHYYVVCSIFYEKLNMKSLLFDKLKISDAVNKPFLDKYGSTDSFGFTLGFGIAR